MKSVTETTAYKGLTQAIHTTLNANQRNLHNRTYTTAGHEIIIELAYKLMDIKSNYINNQEASK